MVICAGWFLWTPVHSSEQELQQAILAEKQGLLLVILQKMNG